MAVNYNKMTMAQLKAELSKRNLQVTGKKSELVSRLEQSDKLMKEKEETEKQDVNTEEDKEEETEAKKEVAENSEEEAEPVKKAEGDQEKEEEKATDQNSEDEAKEEKMETEADKSVAEMETEADKNVDETETGDKNVDETETGDKNVDETETGDKNVDETETGDKNVDETETGDKNVDEMETGDKKEAGDKSVSETDATDIIHQIDDLISDETENGDNDATEDKEESGEKVEGAQGEEKEKGEGTQEKQKDKEPKEEKPEETKVELKKDDYDYTKSASGFVIALDNGKDVVIPVKDMLKIDMKSRRQSKTVLAYPLSIEDLTSGKLNPFIYKCCHFNISFHQYSHEKQKSTKGYAEFIFASDEEAHEQSDLMAEMNDDLVVRQLSRKDKPNNTYSDIPQELITVNNMLKKYIYIGNLPSTATEEELQALFPESNNLAVIVNNDGLPKGYALAELPTAEAVDEAVKKSMKMNYPGYENKLLIMRPWSKIPKGILDSTTRKELLDKIRNLRKLKMKCADDIVRNRLENDMALMKMRLDKDCKARDEVGLPVPPDIVRLEEAKAAKRDLDKTKDKAGANISTIQRGNKSLRRGGGATSAGTFGKKPYQNQGGRAGYSGRQNYRGGSQGFRQGNNQGFRSGNQGYIGSSQGGYQSGFQGAKSGFDVGNLGAKQGFGNGGSYDSNRQGYSQGYGGGYGGMKQGFGGSGGGYDSMKPSYGGGQEPRVNNAVDMLMQVSKMLGSNQKGAGSGYGNQGFNVNNQGTNYSTNTFGSQGNFSNQGNSFGGSFSNHSGGFSGGFKRRGDDVGYGGGGKRTTGYYNQKRW